MTATTTKLTGEVVRSGDSGYEAARIGWNRRYSRYPEAMYTELDVTTSR